MVGILNAKVSNFYLQVLGRKGHKFPVEMLHHFLFEEYLFPSFVAKKHYHVESLLALHPFMLI